MKYLIISDSHHKNDYVKYLVNEYMSYSVIHLGDKNMKIKGIDIRGNCDEEGLDESIIELLGKKCFLTHGNYYQVKYTYEFLYNKAKELNCEIVLFGHTHKRCDFIKDGIRFINPGALVDGYYCLLDKDFIFKKIGE